MNRERAIDIGIALVVFTMTLLLMASGGVSGDEDARNFDLTAVVLAAFASFPLLARRRAPLAVFAVTATASAAFNVLGYPPGPPIGPTVALYFVGLSPAATRTGLRLTAALIVGFFIVHVAAAGIGRDEFPIVPALFGALVWGGAWVFGDRVRMRRQRMTELEERARRAERETERERQLAAAEERTRIARDLHDSAGHAINVILVQAGAARLLAEKDPQGSQAALETIEEVARMTLGEIDQLVGALREDGREALEPHPGLAAMDALVELHGSAGLSITVRKHGPERPLSPGLDQAAYRILQEALTNAARHGDGNADVEITFAPGSLELIVRNPTRPGSASGEDGHGIIGMRERATL